MFEKVNMYHPDKIADRIAGALVDYAYTQEENPHVAVEVLLGHGKCFIISESSVDFPIDVINDIVFRITKDNTITVTAVRRPQDEHLAENQSGEFRCGDNGIFKGVPVSSEEQMLTGFVEGFALKYPYDAKFVVVFGDSPKFVMCQSNANTEELRKCFKNWIVNPLGDWTGGIDVDSGATNRKLGSDMGQSVTGGGLHGKDLSKADVSVNIYAWLKAQETNQMVELTCAIGDTVIDGKPYSEIVEIARKYIKSRGGFEKFAEWGLLY